MTERPPPAIVSRKETEAACDRSSGSEYRKSCIVVGQSGLPPMGSLERTVVVPRRCLDIFGQLCSLWVLDGMQFFMRNADEFLFEYLQYIYNLFTVIFQCIYRQYIQLHSLLSHTRYSAGRYAPLLGFLVPRTAG